MKETIRQLEEWGRIGGNEKFFKRAASIRKALERMEMRKASGHGAANRRFRLSLQDRSGRRVVSFEGVTKRFGDRVILMAPRAACYMARRSCCWEITARGKRRCSSCCSARASPDAGDMEHGARVEIGYLAQQEPSKP